MGNLLAQVARTRMPLLALPHVIVILQPWVVVDMAWAWAAISNRAVEIASTAPTITPGTTSKATLSFRMTAQTRAKKPIELASCPLRRRRAPLSYLHNKYRR